MTTDTERLDWLEANGATVWVFAPRSGDSHVWSIVPTNDNNAPIGTPAVGDTLREAIDAARVSAAGRDVVKA